jgi:hypothetical protein
LAEEILVNEASMEELTAASEHILSKMIEE